MTFLIFFKCVTHLFPPLASNTVESIIPITADRNDTSCSTTVQHDQPLLTSTVISNEPIAVKISNCKSNSAAGCCIKRRKKNEKL